MKTGVVAPGREECLLHEATPPSPRKVSRFSDGLPYVLDSATAGGALAAGGAARNTLILWIEAADGGIDHLGTGISIAHHTHPFLSGGSTGDFFLAFELGFALYETLWTYR